MTMFIVNARSVDICNGVIKNCYMMLGIKGELN